jgi:signal transduction histidine kinase
VARLREHLEARKPRVGEGLAGGAAATATALVANRAADLLAATGDPDGVAALHLRSLLAAPIVSRGSVRGVLASASIAGPLLGDGELRLAQAIAERAGPALENATLWADLQEQMRREQLAQRIKDDFLSIVSHELRTPLTSIQGYSQLLENRIRDTAASDKELGQVRVIRSQVARMRRLVDDLLDVSRIDRSGAVSVDPEPLDLAADLRDAVSRSEREHPDRRLVLNSPETLPMRADRDRIAQVLTNLLDNAIKYSPDGGEVRVTAAQHGKLVSLTVADEGIGIPAEQRDLVFDRFFQADADTRGRRFGGLGLGLYITRAIVEAHGGRIWATANDDTGRGTVMNVELPRLPPKGLPRPAGSEAGEPPPFVVRRSGSPR